MLNILFGFKVLVSSALKEKQWRTMYPTIATCSFRPFHRCHLLFLGLSLICLHFHLFKCRLVGVFQLAQLKVESLMLGVQRSGVTSGGLVAVVRSCQLCSALVYVMLRKPQAAVKRNFLLCHQHLESKVL